MPDQIDTILFLVALKSEKFLHLELLVFLMLLVFFVSVSVSVTASDNDNTWLLSVAGLLVARLLHAHTHGLLLVTHLLLRHTHLLLGVAHLLLLGHTTHLLLGISHLLLRHATHLLLLRIAHLLLLGHSHLLLRHSHLLLGVAHLLLRHLLLLGVTHLLLGHTHLLLGVAHLLLRHTTHLLLALALSGVPLTLQVDLTGGLTLVGDLEPFVETSGSADGGHLHHGGTDGLASCDILVKNFDVEIISDVFDIDSEHLVPNGGLTGVLLDLGLEFLLSVLDLTEGIHLSEELGISGETSLNYGELKTTRCCLTLNHLSNYV
jgi:hypothetical protein